MCLYPRLIRNKKYTSNKKNGGIIPAITDKRVLMVPVGCGDCIECTKQKAREIQVRLLEDIRHNKNGRFVTLTFTDKAILKLSRKIKHLKGYDLDNEIATLATRRFLERWRKKYKKSVRHWLITELGHNGTENIHMHGILYTNESKKEIERIWGYGMVWAGYEDEKTNKLVNYVNEQTVSYITKYITKRDLQHEAYKPKILSSPGIGSGYIKRADSKKNKYRGEETKETYTTRTGHKMALPIYYRNKIYTEEEREKLWLQKLDKNERFVCGEKVDISKTDKIYFNLLNYHRKRSERLGYGKGGINWNKRRYENERRILLQKQRIDRAKGGLGEG